MDSNQALAAGTSGAFVIGLHCLHTELPTTTLPTTQYCRRAYLEKVAAAHPDKGGSPEEFIQIRDAYETLLRGSNFAKHAGDADTSDVGSAAWNAMAEAEYAAWQHNAATQAYDQAVASLQQGCGFPTLTPVSQPSFDTQPNLQVTLQQPSDCSRAQCGSCSGNTRTEMQLQNTWMMQLQSRWMTACQGCSE